MGTSWYYRPKQPVKPQVNQANFRSHFAKSHSPVRRSIPQVNQFNQRRNFSKSKSPVRRPIVQNVAKTSNSYATKGKGGSPTKDLDYWKWEPFKNELTYKSQSSISGSCYYKTYKYVNPQNRPKPAQAWVIKRNKSLILMCSCIHFRT